MILINKHTLQEQLEARLVKFVGLVHRLVTTLLKNETNEILRKQILRSSISIALNYGEARGAQSRNDFVHKLRLCLKEARETLVNLHIMTEVKSTNSILLSNAKDECNQIVSILTASLKTLARRDVDR